MMQRRKIIAVFVLLIGVGFFSYSLFKTHSEENSGTTIVDSKENASDSRFQFVRDGLAETLPSSVPGASEEKASSNLTNRVANLYTGAIIKANKNNVETIKNGGNITLPSQDVFDTTFDSILKEPFRFTAFTKEDIRTSSDNSPETTRVYFLAIQTIISSQLKNSNKEVDALNIFFSKQENDALVRFIGTLNKNVNEILKIEAPSQFATFHLQTLNTFQKKLEAYNAIADMNTDPVKTVVAIDEIPKIAGEIKNISVEITKHILKSE